MEIHRHEYLSNIRFSENSIASKEHYTQIAIGQMSNSRCPAPKSLQVRMWPPFFETNKWHSMFHWNVKQWMSRMLPLANQDFSPKEYASYHAAARCFRWIICFRDKNVQDRGVMDRPIGSKEPLRFKGFAISATDWKKALDIWKHVKQNAAGRKEFEDSEPLRGWRRMGRETTSTLNIGTGEKLHFVESKKKRF